MGSSCLDVRVNGKPVFGLVIILSMMGSCADISSGYTPHANYVVCRDEINVLISLSSTARSSMRYSSQLGMRLRKLLSRVFFLLAFLILVPSHARQYPCEEQEDWGPYLTAPPADLSLDKSSGCSAEQLHGIDHPFTFDLSSAHDLQDWLDSNQSKRCRKAKVSQERTFGPRAVGYCI
jgi:hypothetical protein